MSLDHQNWDTVYMWGTNQVGGEKKEALKSKVKSKEQKIDEKVEDGNFSHKKMDSSYGKDIQKLRLAKGWTQKELAQKLSISSKDIIEIENGKAKHNGRLMSRLNNLFQEGNKKNKR